MLPSNRQYNYFPNTQLPIQVIKRFGHNILDENFGHNSGDLGRKQTNFAL